MISRKFAHKVINKLQEIMGYINLAEIPEEAKRREQHLENAKLAIRQTVALLERHVKKEGGKL